MQAGDEPVNLAAMPCKPLDQQILELFEDGDQALIAADVAELRRIYADDYVQYDERGQAATKQDLIDNLTLGRIRFLSMRSTGRSIRILNENFAIVHGTEDDIIEQDGQRRRVCYVYTDVVMKRSGKWQIVASQLAKSNETS
jgi:ketosteroid isomerase-like protein